VIKYQSLHVNQLPKPVLTEMLRLYHDDPKQLTPIEIQLCKRIALCCHCGNIWVRHAKREPLRCERCKKTHWNAPLLARMLHAVSVGGPSAIDKEETT
jgi:hypothetical protein